MSDKPKIFVFVNGGNDLGIFGCALADDGEVIAGHVSSDCHWLRHDMGVTGNWQHDKYNAHYPEGWELVDLIAEGHELPQDPDFLVAVERNKAREKAEAPHA